MFRLCSELVVSERMVQLRAQSAFSLVELSIVLVILGLLTGGILGGQALIRAAELRSVATELDRYRAASFAFRDKYFSLPGDMTNATEFWGNASTGAVGGECTTPESASGTGSQTCNGNGNGQIARGGPNMGHNNSELFRYWQHLSNAGLIEGQYSGVSSDTPAGSSPWRVAVPGDNVPRLRFGNGGISLYAHAASANGVGPVFWSGGDSNTIRNYAHLGTPRPGDLTWGVLFKSEELWNIDTKLDDGRPGTGIFRANSVNSCVTTGDVATSLYDLAFKEVLCVGLVDFGI